MKSVNSVIVSIEALSIGFKETFRTLSFTLTLSLSLSHEAPYFLFYRATLVNAIFIMIVFLNVKFWSGFAIKVVLY